jgi:hypothetical protein
VDISPFSEPDDDPADIERADQEMWEALMAGPIGQSGPPPPNTPRPPPAARDPRLDACVSFAGALRGPNGQPSIHARVLCIRRFTYGKGAALHDGLRIECVDAAGGLGDLVAFRSGVQHFAPRFVVASCYCVAVKIDDRTDRTRARPSLSMVWNDVPQCTDSWPGGVLPLRRGVEYPDLTAVAAQPVQTVVAVAGAVHKWTGLKAVSPNRKKGSLLILDVLGGLMPIQLWQDDVDVIGGVPDRGVIARFECFRLEEYDGRRYLAVTGGARLETDAVDDVTRATLQRVVSETPPEASALDVEPLKDMGQVRDMIVQAGPGKTLWARAELMFLRVTAAGVNGRAVRPVCPDHHRYCTLVPGPDGAEVFECPGKSSEQTPGSHAIQHPVWNIHCLVLLADRHGFIEARLFSRDVWTRVFWDTDGATLAAMGEGEEQDFLAAHLRVAPLQYLRVNLKISQYQGETWEADLTRAAMLGAEPTDGQLEDVVRFGRAPCTLDVLSGADSHDPGHDAAGVDVGLRQAIETAADAAAGLLSARDDGDQTEDSPPGGVFHRRGPV